MSAMRIAAVILIAAGIVGLIVGNLSFTKETHEAKIGTLEVSVQEKRTIDVPAWASIGAIVIGEALLLASRRKSS